MKNKIRFIFVLAVFLPVIVLADQSSFVLPKAGITPLNPFYFLDKLGESLRDFFTFNKVAKAKLQIIFAAERIAEIKVILETKGVEAKGLAIAENRLKSHIESAAKVIESEKEKGKNVSSLAKELDDEVEISKSVLPSVFKEKKDELKNKEEELKNKIVEARKTDDKVEAEKLNKELELIKMERRLLNSYEKEQKEALEEGQAKIEREMDKKDEAMKAITKAEEEKQEILDEAKEEEIILPLEGFLKFDDMLKQSKELFAKGNFEGAKQLALQARKNLEGIWQIIDETESDAEDNLEDESEIRGGADENETEARGKDAKKEMEAKGGVSENEVKGKGPDNELQETGSGKRGN